MFRLSVLLQQASLYLHRKILKIIFLSQRGSAKYRYLMLKVKGESMVNAGIFDGDQIIVSSQSCAENGDIVVALLEDSATVKRFYKEDGHYRLQPENDFMSQLSVIMSILGKVIGLFVLCLITCYGLNYGLSFVYIKILCIPF